MAKSLSQIRGRALARLQARGRIREIEFKNRGRAARGETLVDPEHPNELPLNQSATISQPKEKEEVKSDDIKETEHNNNTNDIQTNIETEQSESIQSEKEEVNEDIKEDDGENNEEEKEEVND